MGPCAKLKHLHPCCLAAPHHLPSPPITLAQIPLHAHPDPKSVLIVGGGDGGVLREVCRHSSVQKIVMCEIDSQVCQE